VNFFLGVVGAVQVSRILLWQRSAKNESTGEVLAGDAKDLVDSVESAAKSVEVKAKQAVG
jgi:hypothetical protein